MKTKDPIIVCDLSDVLIKGLEGTEKIIASQLNIPIEAVSEMLFSHDYGKLWYGIDDEEGCLRALLQRTQWDIELAALKTAIRHNFTEIEGTRNIYQQLGKKYWMILYSVNCPEWVSHMQDTYKYESLFDEVFYSYDLKSHKKEPSGFKTLQKKYPKSTFYLIDDSRSNIKIAKSLGIQGIHFTSAEQLEKDLITEGIL